MKQIIIISILITIPILFWGQSDSTKAKVPDNRNIKWENDTGYINDEVIFVVVEKMPNYPGGRTAMINFIVSNFQYPIDAYINQVEGRVYITFVVEKTGKLSDMRVLKGIGHGCDEEALRIVKMLVYEKAKNRGIRVTATMRTTINFRLPKKKPSFNITYSTPKEQPEKNKTKEKASKSAVYHYTIQIK